MRPAETDQLLFRRLDDEDEVRRVQFEKLRAPLPFARRERRASSEWSEVRLVERVDVKLRELRKIGGSGVAHRERAKLLGRHRNELRADEPTSLFEPPD